MSHFELYPSALVRRLAVTTALSGQRHIIPRHLEDGRFSQGHLRNEDIPACDTPNSSAQIFLLDMRKRFSHTSDHLTSSCTNAVSRGEQRKIFRIVLTDGRRECSSLTSTVEPTQSVTTSPQSVSQHHLLSTFAVLLLFVMEPQCVLNLHYITCIRECDRVTVVHNGLLQPHLIPDRDCLQRVMKAQRSVVLWLRHACAERCGKS